MAYLFALLCALWFAACGMGVADAACGAANTSCNPSQGRVCCDGFTCLDSAKWPTVGAGTCRASSTATTTSTSVPSTTRPPGTSTSTTRPSGTTTSTTLPAGDDDPTPARFPTARDVSIRIKHDQRCRWWSDVVGGPLRTATQAERAAQFLEEVAVLHPEAMAYAKYTPACASVARGAESDYETDQLRLRSFYVDRQRDSEWGIFGQNSCHPYSHVENLLKDIQRCSTANDKAAQQCAASFYMSGELLDATDMTIRNGRCVVGAPFPTPIYPAKEDQDLRERGHLFYTKPLPDLTPAQLALACTIKLHHQFGSEAKCGMAPTEAEKAVRMQATCGRPYVPTEGVRAAELALLQSAVSERQKHLFYMLFTTKVDTGVSGWTPQDVCDIAMLEHHAWSAWDDFLRLPGTTMWGFITRARVSHETFHLWGAFRSPTVRWRIGNHQTRIMDEPPRTQAQALACLRNGTCRPPWLPADWRVLIGPDRSH